LNTFILDDPQQHAAIVSRIPMGRVGQVSDLFGAAIFLASAASDFVTGHILYVDGGWTAA
jgi:NAD(P)-dependent dehydrogenase (short-subunit alcohol dehydrogenase family)